MVAPRVTRPQCSQRHSPSPAITRRPALTHVYGAHVHARTRTRHTHTRRRRPRGNYVSVTSMRVRVTRAVVNDHRVSSTVRRVCDRLYCSSPLSRDDFLSLGK